MRNANRRIVLRTRPTGIAGPEHFAEETVAIRAPGPGEVLLETHYVSVDPAMRVWISENPGYVQRIEPGETMRASGIHSGGQAPLNQTERREFANHLDRLLARAEKS